MLRKFCLNGRVPLSSIFFKIHDGVLHAGSSHFLHAGDEPRASIFQAAVGLRRRLRLSIIELGHCIDFIILC